MTAAESGTHLDPNLDGSQSLVPHPTEVNGSKTTDLPPSNLPADLFLSTDLIDISKGSEVELKLLESGVIIDHASEREIDSNSLAQAHMKSREELNEIFKPDERENVLFTSTIYHKTRWKIPTVIDRTSKRTSRRTVRRYR